MKDKTLRSFRALFGRAITLKESKPDTKKWKGTNCEHFVGSIIEPMHILMAGDIVGEPYGKVVNVNVEYLKKALRLFEQEEIEYIDIFVQNRKRPLLLRSWRGNIGVLLASRVDDDATK